MLQLREHGSLDGGDLGWLKARHHFLVSPGGNRAHGPLGALRVWNDDEIAPGTGFGMHGHSDMEIITYVREGEVTHEDSLGNVGKTAAGDVQVISAGSGIRHAEQNLGAVTLRIFQIWLTPRQAGGAPHWDQRSFPKADRAGRWVSLASGVESDRDGLPIRANARVLGAYLHAGQTLTYALAEDRHAYLVPARGEVVVNGQVVTVRSGIAANGEPLLTIEAKADAEIILVDAA